MPPMKRVIARSLLRLAVIAVVTYLAVCALMAWQKEAIIFPVHGRERAAGKTAPPGYETWWQTMRDGTRVEAWWRPARGAGPERPVPAVLVFHGNGELIDDSQDFADTWHDLGASVLLVEYRGYGRSEGSPGIATGVTDAAEWFDRVAATPGVQPGAVIAHGFSLGGVFAAELAGVRPVAGLVMEGSVASLRAAARDRGIWLLFTRERFDAEAVLRRLPADVPVVFTHARDDGVVPYRHLGLLMAARPGATVVEGIYGHFPLTTFARPDLLRDLLATVKTRAGGVADNALASPPSASAP